MSHSVRMALRCTTLAFAVLCSLIVAADAQDTDLKKFQWSHAFDLACRELNKTKFEKDTPRWGVEAFRDNNTNFGLYVSQGNTMSLAPNFAALLLPMPENAGKGPVHFTGLDLPARKAGVAEWKGAKVHCMEAFRDPHTDNWLFVTDKGLIAATNGKLFPGVNNKKPIWAHSIDLQARKGGIKEFKDAAKFGIEVYKDGNTGNLIYITEHGHIAILPETKEVKVDGKTAGPAPHWLHGLDLKCRRHDEKTFSDTTRKVGVEVYNDIYTGNLIFISETGSLSVIPAPAKVEAPTPAPVKRPEWKHGLDIKCRPFGKAKFEDATPIGAEVYHEQTLDVYLYVNEFGNIAAHAAK